MMVTENIMDLPDSRRAFLTWQHLDRRRHIVAEVELQNERLVFRYLEDRDLEDAKMKGFTGYPAFPDFSHEYTNGVLESFESRLPSPRRGDFQRYLDYWFVSADASPTPFQLLVHTGGALPRDGFRFIPILPTVGTFEFVTEVAGARRYLDADLRPIGSTSVLQPGESVLLRDEPSNEYDTEAVEVLRAADEKRIGYLMRGLSLQFVDWDAEINATISRINGTPEWPILLLRVRANFR